MQFDGVTDEVFKAIRGRALVETKLAAIQNCARHELGVVLVPTLIPGINTGQIGEILRTAIAIAPVVRAVHFQPSVISDATRQRRGMRIASRSPRCFD